MKKSFLAFALFFAAPAFSAPCNVQGLPKISGLSYHLARVKLIHAGFLPTPSEEFKTPRHIIGPGNDDSLAIGYHEASQPSNGIASRSFDYPRFTVYTTGCEDLTNPAFQCKVKRIYCH